jgi:hypothetical protein
MFNFLFLRFFLFLYFLIFFIISGCGKKVISEEPNFESQRQDQTYIEESLQKQDVNCENNQPCPSYIAKIIVASERKFTFCTGFLIDQSTIATSATCIPQHLRLAGQDCSRDIFFFFPKTANRPAERVGCNKITLVSHIEGQDPLLWRDDVAYIQLSDKLMYRREAQIAREGVENDRQYTSWMISQEDEYSAVVRKLTCTGIHNSFINPLSVNESSPNMLFSDCNPPGASTGAPILDSRGKIRAIYSKEISQKLRNYLDSTGLLIKPLKEISHATNFACAPTPSDSEMLDERECLKDLNYSIVDHLRGEMLSNIQIFGELKRKYEDSLRTISPFVQFGINLISKGDLQSTQVVPKCFKPLRNWLPYMSIGKNTHIEKVVIPLKGFKRSMDPYGRIFGSSIDETKKEFFIQYSLKNLRISGKTSILMWNNQDNKVSTFSNISDLCSLLP